MTVTVSADADRARRPAHPHHRRREARHQRALHPGRALGALRPGAARRPRHASTSPTATGSCCPRATARSPTTPCSRPRASSRTRGSTTSPPGPARSAIIRTGCSSRASRSPPARSGTACRSASASRSVSGPRAWSRRASTSSSVTPSSTRAPTTRRSPTPAPPGWTGLTVVVVDNESATHGWPGGIAARFTVNGWTAPTVDGHDHDAIERALRAHDSGPPAVWSPGRRRHDDDGMTMRRRLLRRPTRACSTTTRAPRWCSPTSRRPRSFGRPATTPTGSSTSASASS